MDQMPGVWWHINNWVTTGSDQILPMLPCSPPTLTAAAGLLVSQSQKSRECVSMRLWWGVGSLWGHDFWLIGQMCIPAVTSLNSLTKLKVYMCSETEESFVVVCAVCRKFIQQWITSQVENSSSLTGWICEWNSTFRATAHNSLPASELSKVTEAIKCL